MAEERTIDQLSEVVLPGIVEPDALRLSRRAVPTPGPNQVLVRVEATGVSFAELAMRRGRYYDQPSFPFVPGYDLVGVVAGLGAGVDPALTGRRVAALTKIGGWTTHALVDAADLVAVPDGVDPVAAETVVVNGITAWQMLHRKARIRRGHTILVHGANGGVGSTLAQLASAAGVRVIGTASARHHDVLRALGIDPVDYRTEDVPARVRELAPDGVDAVFDNVGGQNLTDAWHLLRRGGTLVSYGAASTLDGSGSAFLPMIKILARMWWWNAAPNGRHAYLYNLWAGRKLTRRSFTARLRTDLTAVYELVASGRLVPQVAATLPLSRTAEAMKLAESRTAVGKVVLIP
ncbi:medium chain dehydrogenase/reductase family protein [Streptomyces sp. SL13]|uniref:Medium chain dehydrogenase/reductase family protein n=1 Tax=Streptantibioticus silvisoli TaxID=2705255 RepID=A0AA90H389_9ACTN|nr:medium chain dehydrogenase/reductase family protein [Streptantibioticus silvisoli]MDI5973293.1 medium chain dehydrogenase/reductase family protein [Streptantibioticus silvisoli]